VIDPEDHRVLPDVTFRSASAPGLDEDDLFAAILGLPGTGALWGDGRPAPTSDDLPWDEERERRQRHEETLRRWDGSGS
jgi:hypothetical protein